ncbi:30S ribosomal protein S21 [Candidatus Woesebacteria bacterium]|nr:30S ribosomal protein S21 [Candidatus Woesebacteria bacterium]
MVVIKKKKGESKDSAFRKFTRAFIEEEIVDEIRSRMYYVKPSQLRKQREQMQRSKKRSHK